VEDLTRFAVEDGIGTFIVMTDDPSVIQTFAAEVVPGVRAAVAAHRSGQPPTAAVEVDGGAASAAGGDGADGEPGRLGITPTPDSGLRLSSRVPWDERARPHRAPAPPDAVYTEEGRRQGQLLVDVHNYLRSELTELRDVLSQVRDGALSAGAARSVLNEMALRQNDWTLGAFCARYCGVVTMHHGAEDGSVFPALVASDPSLAPVTSRLSDEHLVIHDAIQMVDRSLVAQMTNPEADHFAIQEAIDFLTDSLLSHLSYEEGELVEPLARSGSYIES
jgi:hemerythrin-like domain-containing protein